MLLRTVCRKTVVLGIVPFFIMGCSEETSENYSLDENTDTIILAEESEPLDPTAYNLALIEERLNDDNLSDDDYWSMVRDMGGTYAFMKFSDEATYEELTDKYMQYGLEYVSELEQSERAPDAPKHVKVDCPNYFNSSVSNKTWELREWLFGNHTTSIDRSGRPFLGVVEINFGVRPTDVARSSGCAWKVGRMGGRTTDDAGHLIAKGLGGWNKRANLVPQNKNVNRGTINNVIEKSVRTCAQKPNSLIKYGVTANYRDNWNLRPTHFDVEIWVSRFTGVGIPGLLDAIPKYKHARIRNESANGTDRSQANNFAAFVARWC